MATITNCSTKAQTLEKESTTFEEKPITFLQKQLIAKPTIEQLKKQIPKGYSLADETKKIITFEKIVGNKHYEITYMLDEKQKIFTIMFSFHSNRVFHIMDEFTKLGYTKDESLTGMLANGIEVISYKNRKLRHTGMITINENIKQLTVVLSSKGYKE